MIYKVEAKTSFVLKADTMIRSIMIQQNKKTNRSTLKLDPYSISLVLSNQHRLGLRLSLKYKSL